ncbi:hypothetical protein BJ875DRAFT_441584 [Amylocarpus encephaloides]|uniref:LIM zinc-binding domain-containing protein n=1 Tax=Amylocarpus encephaloides TaxID=45428 RepID=A0A9P7YHW2_9HELO|nr:hypothetical protein BJ875DRAFT_441584 [Amylocarpus encephaloides]
MLLRGRSKDRTRKVTPPGPVAMSNEQFAGYLADLRNNRVSRPSGARPQPASSRGESTDRVLPNTQTPQSAEFPERTSSDYGPRSASALSHKRAQSSLSTYSVASRTGRQLVQQPGQPPSTAPLRPSEVVPSATYIERGQRWMEKEEAVSLREAMEDMDIKKQEYEARLHAAAQNEASELVFQHQNPETVNPDAPYKYNEHLRKNSYAHARTQSVGRYGSIGMVTGLARDMPQRSVSGGSSCSGGIMSPRNRVSFGSSDESDGNLSPEPKVRHSLDSTRSASGTTTNSKSYGSIVSNSKMSSSRRRSSAKRNISGEIGSAFTGSQIWEEPEENLPRGRPQEESDMPAPLRIKLRNPLNRVQFVQDVGARSSSTPPEPTKKLHKTEIHQNPPTQSRNPLYTANSLPITTVETSSAQKDTEELAGATKDGLEIRSDEIRQATSMRLKDRSPKLPTPTVVSDKPGRPIVSFDNNWKPKEADVKPEVRRRSPFDRPSGQRQSIPTRSDPKNVTPPVEAILLPKSLPDQVEGPPFPSVPPTKVPETQFTASTPIKAPERKWSTPSTKLTGPRPSDSTRRSLFARPSIPSFDRTQSSVPAPVTNESRPQPPIPIICLPDERPSLSTIKTPHSAPSIPIINQPDSTPSIPTINLPGPTPSIPKINLPDTTPSIPTINFPDTPDISVSAPEVSTINITPSASGSTGQRPLPDPKTAASRPRHRPHGHAVPDVSRGHWSAAGTTAGKRATATCHQCTLPIEGRVVAIAGKPQHFHPQCFICFNCGTGLESLEIRFEPEARRAERIDRIKRRARGEELPEIEGQTMAEDGDERMRFYCHLDWHEAFAPRCKHCKTPILGEHTIALGEHWHYGHFFCAECGDPFERGQTHIEKDGYAWCLECQTKRTANRAPKCKKCKKPVIGQYVQALGGEWHDECFRCHECQHGFDDSCFYPKKVGIETHVLCIKCLETQLKA